MRPTVCVMFPNGLRWVPAHVEAGAGQRWDGPTKLVPDDLPGWRFVEVFADPPWMAYLDVR